MGWQVRIGIQEIERPLYLYKLADEDNQVLLINTEVFPEFCSLEGDCFFGIDKARIVYGVEACEQFERRHSGIAIILVIGLADNKKRAESPE